MARISNERKIVYYIGIVMIVIGFILFVSVFISIASFMKEPFGGGGPFGGNGPFESKGPSNMNAVIGMILMIAGGVVMSVGAKGAAGSGLLLDPEKAREDLKPFSEAKGRMINDVISNIDAVDKISRPQAQNEIIKIKCRSCGSLNDEDAKYCKGCGGGI